MRVLNITYPDVNNGLGCRATLWVAGCSHHCKGCHNKETWSFDCGKEFDEEYKQKLFDIVSLPYIKGLTLSGGDPLDSYDDVLSLLKDFYEKFDDTKDVWLYTGYTMEELFSNGWKEILCYVDYVVDGRYEEDKRDVSLAFRGSKNQTIYEKCGEHFIKSKLNDGK